MSEDEEINEHGEKVLEKVRAMNKRDFNRALARDRTRRTDAGIKAAYKKAMEEKAGTP